MRGQPAGAARPIASLLALLCLALLAVACDGTQLPQVIASYPRQDPPPPNTAVTEAHLELEVRDMDAAVETVEHLAARYGGYVVETQHWGSHETRAATLTVLVPAADFKAFNRALRALGPPTSERLTERVDGYRVRSTQVRVILRETAPALVAPRRAGWNPVATFRAAFAVFTSVFQVLVDGLIWIVVVAGPFALMALGLLALMRRLRRPPIQHEE